MKVIHEEKKIRSALGQLNLSWTQQIPVSFFALHQYEKGELLVAPEQPSEFLLICISGYARMYDLNANSGIMPIGLLEKTGVIGDMEFCGKTEKNYFVEAAGRMQFLALPMQICLEKLWNDPAFLHFILDSISEKLSASTLLEISSVSLEEKVLQYLEHAAASHRLQGVGDTAMKLHCSRRQLQRVLQKLCREGILQKEGKGCYCLVNPEKE